MLDVADVLSAHIHCKVRLAEMLSQPTHSRSSYCDFAPDQDHVITRFIRERQRNPKQELELTKIRAAHATVNSVIIGLAQKRAAGLPINVEREFSPRGNFGAASQSLVNAIWALEKKLHSLAR
jgi:hypothetical protein